MQGIINWYHPGKGFGFIKSDDNSEIFFHISGFNEFKKNGVTLGTKVEYDVRDGKKGLEAFNIKEIKDGRKDSKQKRI
ncbi:MAG: cold-shock protein [Promethearchaeota archaeon]